MARGVRTCAWLACIVAIAGCAALESELERRRPTAEVVGARVAGLSFDAARLELDVRVDNPNPVGVDLAGLDYAVALEGRRILSGERERRLAIPADAARTLSLPIDVAFADAAGLLDEVGPGDTAAYAVELGLALDVPLLGRQRVPVRAEGRMPVPRAPEIRVADLRLDRLDWSGARLVFALAVHNPNTFGFALERLDYALRVEGTEWASAGAEPGTRVPARGSATVALPFSVDFGSIGRGAYRLLSGGGAVEYALEGRTAGRTVGAAPAPFEQDFRETGRLRLGGQ